MPGNIHTSFTGQLSPELRQAHEAAVNLFTAASLGANGLKLPGTDTVGLVNGENSTHPTVRGDFANNEGLESYNSMVGVVLRSESINYDRSVK